MYMEENVSHLEKQVVPGSVDVHPTEKALVVNYETYATAISNHFNPLQKGKQCQKVIRCRNLHPHSDIKAMAKDIFNKCGRLIAKDSLADVEQLLYYLQNRKDRPIEGGPPKQELKKEMCDEDLFPSTALEEEPDIRFVDDYQELLYDDDTKVKGSALILRLTRNPDNFVELATKMTLFGTLARVLREDWRRNTDVAINIIYIFYCFSAFDDFHPMITDHKIGSLCLDILDQELKNYDTWWEDLIAKKKLTLEKKLTSDQKKQAVKNYQKCKQQFKSKVQKQEQFLHISLFLLLNLASDVQIQKKMHKKSIVRMLTKALERNHSWILLISITFLLKLSLYRENKDEMAEYKIIEKLTKLVPAQYADLQNQTLCLLLNLTHDYNLRNKMIKTGMMPRLVELLADENHYMAALKILYQMSIDNKAKNNFAFTDCIPILMAKLGGKDTEAVNFEIMALLLNLGKNKRCAQIICEGKGLHLLMKRGFKQKDTLTMKIIRNLSEHHGGLKELFIPYISNITEAVVSEDSPMIFKLEALGILGNLTIPDLDYEALMEEYNLVPWIRNHLMQSDVVDDDLLLLVILLIGTVCNDDASAKIIAGSGFIESLIRILHDKQEDHEFVLQIMYVFYQLIFHEATREHLIHKTEAPGYLIELANDLHPQILGVCVQTLDIIAENSEKWAKQIQIERFKNHNAKWIEKINEIECGGMTGGGDDIDWSGNICVDPGMQDPYYHGEVYGDMGDMDGDFHSGDESSDDELALYYEDDGEEEEEEMSVNGEDGVHRAPSVMFDAASYNTYDRPMSSRGNRPSSEMSFYGSYERPTSSRGVRPPENEPYQRPMSSRGVRPADKGPYHRPMSSRGVPPSSGHGIPFNRPYEEQPNSGHGIPFNKPYEEERPTSSMGMRPTEAHVNERPMTSRGRRPMPSPENRY